MNSVTQLLSVQKKEYLKLKEKAQLNDELLVKLVSGLEDIRAGRIKPWRKSLSK